MCERKSALKDLSFSGLTRESIKIKALCLFPYGLPDHTLRVTSKAMTCAAGGREAAPSGWRSVVSDVLQRPLPTFGRGRFVQCLEDRVAMAEYMIEGVL